MAAEEFDDPLGTEFSEMLDEINFGVSLPEALKNLTKRVECAEELLARERELSEQLFRLRVQKSIGQLDNAVKIREVRRDIARVKTVLREKQGLSPSRRGLRPHKPAPSADKQVSR